MVCAFPLLFWMGWRKGQVLAVTFHEVSFCRFYSVPALNIVIWAACLSEYPHQMSYFSLSWQTSVRSNQPDQKGLSITLTWPALHHDDVLRNTLLFEAEYYLLASQNSFLWFSGSPIAVCDRVINFSTMMKMREWLNSRERLEKSICHEIKIWSTWADSAFYFLNTVVYFVEAP